MGVLKISDNAATTLATSLTTSPATVTLVLTNAANFPVVNHGGTGDDWSYATLFDSAGNIETVKITRRDTGSNSLTMIRGTTAGITGVTDASCLAWSSGTTGVACRLVAQTVMDLFQNTLDAETAATASAASASAAAGSASAAATSLSNIGPTMAAASEKTTPVDADTIPVTDSAAGNALKKLTWANLKATAKTYFDTLYAKIGAITSNGNTMATARLLGRTTASTGAIEEISVGTGLSLSGGSLTCTVSAPVTSVGGYTGAVSAANLLASIQTVDGAGSGLDADLLDGQSSAYYQVASTAITTSNIASQSVNYATSAGSATSATNADTLDGYHYNNLPYAPTSGGNYVAKDNGYNTVGSFAMAYQLVNVSQAGTTCAASLLYDPAGGSGQFTGTWRCLCSGPDSTPTLFQRIS